MLRTRIALTEPIIDQSMIDAAIHALKNERLIRGKSIKEFEEAFREYIGCKHALAVNSGTTALHLSLLSSNIREGSIVATTPASFIATANVIRYIHADPLFVDISMKDYNIDYGVLEDILKRQKIDALIIVHLYGNPVDMDEILRLKDRYKFVLIEDACQAHGASYNGRMIGSIGDIAAFSFYPSKNITVGGDGGMVTTSNDSIAERVSILRDVGRYNDEHLLIGYTARMNTINAAIGKMQLKHIDEWLSKRRKIASYYLDNLRINGIILPDVDDYKKHAWHLFVIRYKERDRLRSYLSDKGIETGIHYSLPIHLQKPYRELGYKEGMYPNAERWSREVLSLPLHPNLTLEEVDYVISSIKEYVMRN